MQSQQFNKCSFINEFLFAADYSKSLKLPWAFYVHASIMYIWQKQNLFKNIEWVKNEERLQIGAVCYNMRLIIISKATKNQISFLKHLIITAQYSFPWLKNPTLFIDLASFHIMEGFIRYHKLETYILKIKETLGITANDEIIKVVSFKKSVSAKLDIIKEYEKYLIIMKKFGERYYYFMTNCFPWQQTYWLKKVHMPDNICSVFTIILKHLGTLNYTNDLDITDLLSLRLALSDYRHDLSQSKPVINEIEFMIKRELTKIVKNNNLNLYQYLIDKNRTLISSVIYYLVYEYQHFFETLNIIPILKFHSLSLTSMIKLNEKSNFLNELKDKFNVNYHIDGVGFDQMSFSLFCDIIGCHNVTQLFLDTNHRWIKDMSKHNGTRPIFNANKMFVKLIGENTYNFVEDFVADLKTIKCTFSLVINCGLNDYKIFDNLTVPKISFENIKIDANMLESFNEYNFKPTISLRECSFESSCRNWKLLHNISNLYDVHIVEDEDTWPALFEFVLNEMFQLNTNEFQFKIKTKQVLVKTGRNSINLEAIKFTLDKHNTKLDVYDKDNEIIDLFHLKFNVEPNEKSGYEFYE